MPKRLLICLWSCVLSGLPAVSAPAEPLRSVAAMLELSPAQLAEQPAVEFEAVALCALQHGNQLAVWQDGVGIYVHAAWGGGDLRKILPTRQIAPGDRLRITGTIHRGDVSPAIVPTLVERLGPCELPEAQAANLLDMLSGRLSSQWVRVEGVVQAAMVFPGRDDSWLIQIGTPLGRFAVRMPRQGGVDPRTWIDAEVSIRGTCMCYLNQRGEMMGVTLLANSASDVTLLDAAPEDPFAVPTSDLGRLQGYSPHGLMPHRRKIAGTVTLCRPGAYLYLQEGDRGVKVLSSDPTAFQPGARVEAAGFVVRKDRVLAMEHALLRQTGNGPPPEPLEITQISPDLLRRPTHPPPYDDLNGRLVELTGTLELDGEDLEGRWISVVSGETVVHARLPQEMRGELPRRGSLIRLTGICELEYPNHELIETVSGPSGIRLLMRDSHDMALVKAAPWWTPQRLWIAIAAMAALLMVSLAWARILNRKVRQRSMELAQEISSRKVAETRTEERTRIAEELHDTVAQGLTGVSLQLEAAGRAARERPAQLPHHLQLAGRILNVSRDEIRRSLWNLRSGLLDTHDLIGSLRAIAANLSPDRSPEITCRCVGTMRPLPERVAHALLRIAQEAMSNAVNHASAQAVEVVVEFSPKEVMLVVRDDGRGFANGKVAALDATHFGLQGMRGRARRLNGQFAIETDPGRGTAVRASFPDKLAADCPASPPMP